MLTTSFPTSLFFSCALDCGAPIGPPTLADHSPQQDDMLSGDTVELRAVVFDDDINRVSFRIQHPDGTRDAFTQGTLLSSTGSLSTWTFSVDTSAQKGIYGFRVRMVDNSGNTVEEPVTILTVLGGMDGGGHGGGGNGDDFIEFLVADSADDLIDTARDDITSLIAAHPTNLAAKFVRMGFHDCVGGCDGCIDLTNGDNFGLEEPIDALAPLVARYEHLGLTRADIWVLASLEGARGAQANGDNLPFEMTWFGRPNCEDTNVDSACVENECSKKRGPHRELPSPHVTTHELISFFNAEFNFQEPWQTVALMGAHTLGTLSRENSGFHGPNGWLGNTNRLDSNYFNDIVGGTLTDFLNDDFEAMMDAANWQTAFYNNTSFGTPDRVQWERRTPPEHFVMLNADMALVRDLSGFIDDDAGSVTQVRQHETCILNFGCLCHGILTNYVNISQCSANFVATETMVQVVLSLAVLMPQKHLISLPSTNSIIPSGLKTFNLFSLRC